MVPGPARPSHRPDHIAYESIVPVIAVSIYEQRPKTAGRTKVRIRDKIQGRIRSLEDFRTDGDFSAVQFRDEIWK